MGSQPIRIRTSERRAFKQCPQKWEWSWRQGLSAKEPAKALWFGTGIHAALADYYQPGAKRSKHFIEVWRAHADEDAQFIRTKSQYGADEDQLVDARLLGETMLKGYVAEYQGDPRWDVIATEQPFEVKIPFMDPPYPDSDDLATQIAAEIRDEYGEFFIYNGTFDGVYRDKDTKKIRLMEHKTAGSISTNHLTLDDQAGSYWAVASHVLREQGVLGKGESISGITYNFLRKALPDERAVGPDGMRHNKPTKDVYLAALKIAGLPTPRLLKDLADTAARHGLEVWGEVSKRQPPPLFERHDVKRTPKERRTQIDRIRNEVNMQMLMRLNIQPVSKTPSKDCAYGCQFFQMCELHEQGVGWEDFRDLVFNVEDPYAAHRDRKSA
jgi:hypothetical protein